MLFKEQDIVVNANIPMTISITPINLDRYYAMSKDKDGWGARKIDQLLKCVTLKHKGMFRSLAPK